MITLALYIFWAQEGAIYTSKTSINYANFIMNKTFLPWHWPFIFRYIFYDPITSRWLEIKFSTLWNNSSYWSRDTVEKKRRRNIFTIRRFFYICMPKSDFWFSAISSVTFCLFHLKNNWNDFSAIFFHSLLVLRNIRNMHWKSDEKKLILTMNFLILSCEFLPLHFCNFG